MLKPLRDRREAGRLLAATLSKYRNDPDVVVLALPRGGVPVGYEIAVALGAPLDVFVVRKLGLPWHEEFAMGAIASGGTRVLDPDVIRASQVAAEEVEWVAAAAQRELERQERTFRGDRPFPELAEKIVILVDDGLATGSTMRAAAIAVRQHSPRRIVVAVPVAAPETCDAFRGAVDEIVCMMTPRDFRAVGLWYRDFAPTSDEEVHDLLDRAAQMRYAKT
jgi:putative phosphoribosyl transferase